MKRLISYPELKGKGIHYSRQHLWRLEKQGKWPKRVPISAHYMPWIEEEIDALLRERLAARDRVAGAV